MFSRLQLGAAVLDEHANSSKGKHHLLQCKAAKSQVEGVSVRELHALAMSLHSCCH